MSLHLLVDFNGYDRAGMDLAPVLIISTDFDEGQIEGAKALADRRHVRCGTSIAAEKYPMVGANN